MIYNSYLKKGLFLASFLLQCVLALPLLADERIDTILYSKDIITGSEQLEKYLPAIKDKNVAILANHTSLIGETHLVDTLLKAGVKISKVFCPEHGFRGTADAGEKVKNYKDKKTGLPIISLYGANKKPKPADLKGIDVVIFDMQDVGARFYTYISTMHYMMEACAENKVKFVVLDRPNPNGFYVDGPVLEKEFTSFVGLHPVPIVHGCTVGEYAQMINEEGWLANKVKCDLSVVSCKNYHHKDFYPLPVKPSPNLPNMSAVYLYPSVCLFEGTIVSVGRGTEKPFQVIGFPGLPDAPDTFTPKSTPGASKNPPYENVLCNGFDISLFGETYMKTSKKLYLFWLMDLYKNAPDKTTFFNTYFNNLAGNSKLKEQIISGTSEEEIKKSWEPALSEYKKIRKKYLLYPDFE